MSTSNDVDQSIYDVSVGQNVPDPRDHPAHRKPPMNLHAGDLSTFHMARLGEVEHNGWADSAGAVHCTTHTVGRDDYTPCKIHTGPISDNV